MTRSGPDAAFERALFDSGRRDGPTAQQQRAAWQALVGSGALVVHQGAPVVQGRGLFGVGAGKVAAWVVAGALGGSALTFALFFNRNAPAPIAPARTAVVVADEPLLAGEPVHTPPSAPGTAEPTRTTSSVRTLEVPERLRQRVASMPNGQSVAPTKTAPESTLEREVAALDSARLALWQRSFEAVVRGVAAFHAEFPRSQLAPDAEALAIEALRRKGDLRAAEERVERFLRSYPDDPHARRLREPH
jgi:hypothetical protein